MFKIFTKKCKCEKEVIQLRKDLDSLSRVLKDQDATSYEEMNLFKSEIRGMITDIKIDLGQKMLKFENEINKKLFEFEKETTAKVADRYFKTLEDIFRWNREFSFLDKYMNDNGLEDLKAAITEPFLKLKWNAEEKEAAGKIDNAIKTKGEFMVQKRKELHDLKLKLGREEKSTTQVDAQIELLDVILGALK